MKKLNTMLIALLACGALYGAQDTDILPVEVRNPKLLEVWLEANASDAESRLASVTTNGEFIALMNQSDAGTAYVELQADAPSGVADDAGDKYRILATDGSGLEIQSDATSKGTMATKASVENDGTITTLVGIDAIGAVDFDIGSADVTDVTVTTDGGDVVLDGTIVADGAITGDDLVSVDDVTVGDDLVVTGAASVGETLAQVGVATFTAQPILNGGIDINEDVDIDLDATDEEVDITTSSGAAKVARVYCSAGNPTTTSLLNLEYAANSDSDGTFLTCMDNSSADTVFSIGEDGNTTIAGTLAVTGASTLTGVGTFTGMPVFNGGVDINEDIDIDFDAVDEEIIITQSEATGMSGVPLMFINDDRTGGNADQATEATISIDAEGTYGIAINDGALYVEVVTALNGALTASGNILSDEIDAATATALLVGKATATGVTIGASDANTTIAGTLELGNASDTTVARQAAANVTVEGRSVVVGASTTALMIQKGTASNGQAIVFSPVYSVLPQLFCSAVGPSTHSYSAVAADTTNATMSGNTVGTELGNWLAIGTR